MPSRKALLATVAATAALVVSATADTDASQASPVLPWALPAGVGLNAPNSGNAAGTGAPCDAPVAGGQASGYVFPQQCQGAGLAFVGPSVGQVATVVGPTIISPAVVGNSVQTSTGSIAGP